MAPYTKVKRRTTIGPEDQESEIRLVNYFQTVLGLFPYPSTASSRKPWAVSVKKVRQYSVGGRTYIDGHLGLPVSAQITLGKLNNLPEDP